MDGSYGQAATTRAQRLRDGIARLRATDRRRLLLMVVPPVIVLLLVGAWLLASAGHVSTDNATVGAARAPISSNVRGRVIEVLVHENQSVKRGDVLFRLDRNSIGTNVDEAEANLAAARLRVAALRAAYREADANTRATQATASHAASEARRQQRLFAEGIVSRQDLDRFRSEALVASREAAASAQAEANALANLGGRINLPTDQHPLVLQAAAALKRAKDDLGYTDVRAPIDGVVTRTQQLQIGSYVQPAQTVFYLVSGRPWIDAAFKENQIGALHPGQPVTIHIDAYPNRSFQGHVESLSPGTGSSFAVLPAENASGNWVRVVQRLNVRVVFDDPPPEASLAIGLSARVNVDARRKNDLPLRGRE